MDEIALHDNPGSCWVRYYNDVYDLTYYSHPSPPGQSVIYLGCGRDSTRDFASAHPRHLLEDVEEHRIGWVETSSASPAKIGIATAFVAAAPIFCLLM
jgi:cytochrome b involved in lipid metabolism